MAEKECDDCGCVVRLKYIQKIRGKYFCKACAKNKRLARREETIKRAGIKEELKELKRLEKNSYNRKYNDKRKIFKKKKTIEGVPVPKGSTSGKAKPRHISESYLGFEESQVMLKLIMKRGSDFEEAKNEIKSIKNQLRDTREKMKEQNKSEKQIKIKQQALLEELWQS